MYLRQEPYAVVPHVRICAGGGQRIFCLSVSVFMVSPDWGKGLHHFTAA